MANLTKEQINLCTWIGSALLLFGWIAFPSIKLSFMGISDTFSMINGLSGLGFIFTIVDFLMFLCPLYMLLYCFKDKLKALNPLFILDRKLAGIVLAAVAVVFILLLFVVKVDSGMGFKGSLSPAFGSWLYLIIAAAICYLGFEEKK